MVSWGRCENSHTDKSRRGNGRDLALSEMRKPGTPKGTGLSVARPKELLT